MAPDRRGVGSEESVRSSIFGHLGLLAVEGEVGTVQTEGDGRHADIVLRQPEADRQGVVDRTAADTTYEIDKRRVEEVVLHFVGEIIGAGKGVPAAGYHGVSVQTCLDVVLADRYADGVFPLRVGLFHLAVGSHQLAVDIETDTLGRDVRAGVIDMSTHGEGADVLKVDIVRREGRRADEHRAFLGIEPVDAQLGRDLVVRTALLEGDAADDVVALAVGQSVQTEALRHVGSGGHVRTYLGVVELVDTVLAGYIEGVFHDAQSFVERPVEEQTFLRAAEDSAVVVFYLLAREGAAPQAHFVHAAGVGASRCAVVAADAERQHSGGLDGLPSAVSHLHTVGAQAVGSHVETPLATAVRGGDMGEVGRGERQRGELGERGASVRAVDSVEVEHTLATLDSQFERVRELQQLLPVRAETARACP